MRTCVEVIQPDAAPRALDGRDKVIGGSRQRSSSSPPLPEIPTG
jgi:hypothetical protein